VFSFRKSDSTSLQFQVNGYYLVENTEVAGKSAVHFLQFIIILEPTLSC